MTNGRRRLQLGASLGLIVTSTVLVGGCMALLGCCPFQCQQSEAVQDVTAAEAYALIQDNQGDPNFVVLDVRTPQEFADEHIANAVNLNVDSGSFTTDVDQLDKNRTYLVYCRSGVRSSRAAGIMAGLGFTHIYNMTGGIEAWKAAGYNVTQD